MLVCDCKFWQVHQEGVTEKELAAMTERAKQLTVTSVSSAGEVRIYLVRGGEANHYVTSYPGGDKEGGSANGSANCKHLIAVRKSLGGEHGQAQSIQETVYDEAREEDYEASLSTGVSAVG